MYFALNKHMRTTYRSVYAVLPAILLWFGMVTATANAGSFDYTFTGNSFVANNVSPCTPEGVPSCPLAGSISATIVLSEELLANQSPTDVSNLITGWDISDGLENYSSNDSNDVTSSLSFDVSTSNGVLAGSFDLVVGTFTGGATIEGGDPNTQVIENQDGYVYSGTSQGGTWQGEFLTPEPPSDKLSLLGGATLLIAIMRKKPKPLGRH
jgi:hypothetical protein